MNRPTRADRRARRFRLRRSRQRFLPTIQPLEGRQLLSVVDYLGTDTTTQGNWKGIYGADGYDIADDPSSNNPSLPSYASLSVSGQQDTGPINAGSDPRALLAAAPDTDERLGDAWYTGTSFSINLTLSDDSPHLLALYAVDFDGFGGGRSERIDLLDDTSDAVLDSRTVSDFGSGEYLVWNVTGSVTIDVTNLNPSSNAVLDGLFLSGPGSASGPTVATPAAASPSPVTGTTASLSTLGADLSYPESALTYTWTATAAPAGAPAPSFSVNGTNAAQQTTVTFDQAGSYTFLVTIADPDTLAATSSVTVTVAQTPSAITVAPASRTVIDTATQTFTAIASDQFGQALASQPAFAWSVDGRGAGGTIDASGLYTAPSSGSGSDTILAASSGVSGTAEANDHQPPTLAPIANQTDPSGTTLTVTLEGSDPDRDTLTYGASAETQAYWLEQTYGFYEQPVGYYTNARGQEEKYLQAKVSANNYNSGGDDPWYYILPNGNLYEFTPPYSTVPLTGALVAQLGAAVYNDPSLLWNAQDTTVPASLAVSGNQLTITPADNYTGTFVVVASASDGPSAVTSSFTVTAPTTLSLWNDAATPSDVNANSTPVPLDLGVRFYADVSGTVTAVSFYKSPGGSELDPVSLWSPSGTLLATATASSETASGWQTIDFATPVTIVAGQIYTASYHNTDGQWPVDISYFTSGLNVGVLHTTVNAGVFNYGSGVMPTASYESSNYWVDVVFTPTPPTITSTSPTAGATGVATSIDPTIVFSQPMNASTINASTVELLDASNNVVSASVTYSAAAMTATLTPTAALAAGADYTLQVQGGDGGVEDLAGNPLASNDLFAFTTVDAPTTLSLWNDAATPSDVNANSTPVPLDLGVRFYADVSGTVTAVSFYKSPGGSELDPVSLWSPSGTLLATATASSETASGWQTIDFAAPVTILAGQIYTASYHNTDGQWPVDINYFTSDLNVGVLHTPVNAGVFNYGSGVMPTNSYESSNYWVDVVFTPTPPTITSTSPTAGATGVATSIDPTIVFSQPMNASTINASTVELLDASNNVVSASVTYSAAAMTATLTPTAALAAGADYTLQVQGGDGGVEDLAGSPLASNDLFAFTTVDAPTTLSLWDDATTPSDVNANSTPVPLDLGVRFYADVSGTVTAVSFYKSPGGSELDPVSLWSPSGTLLATATASSETASGWQTIDFATPVTIVAGQIYTASYHNTDGQWPVDISYFTSGLNVGVLHTPVNAGVFNYGSGVMPTASYESSNYWVDVVFTPTPPTVASTSPTAGATGVATSIDPTIVFSQSMNASTINASTVELLDASNNVVSASVTYSAAAMTATLTPTAALAAGADYTLQVQGGDGGVEDLAGSPLASNDLFAFTTVTASQQPAPPTVVTPAAASPSPVTGITAALSALGADIIYAATALTYTWATTAVPTGAPAPTFSVNDSNAAQQTTVTFDQAGSYTFQVTIADPGSLTVTSSVSVTVAQTLTAIAVAPASATVTEGATELFAALALDQFGQALASQPAFTWSVASGGAGGSVSTSALYTAPGSETGGDTVRATSGTVGGTAAVTVLSAAATVSFLGADTTTGGNWEETYGSAGYDIPGLTASLPAYALVTPGSSASANVWTASATDPRALQEPGSSGRIASGWFSGTSATETIDVNLNDGQSHLLALDAMDWDGAGGGRSEKVELISDATSEVLDTQTLNDFGGGVYLVWQVTGSVTIQVTSLNAASNAVVNGLFLSSPSTPLTAQGLDLSTFAGAAYSGPVATFTDANPSAAAGDFTATITWGDGHTSPGRIAAGAEGGFVVTGTDTYSTSGTDAVTVQIEDGASHQASAQTTATVVHPPMLSSVTIIQEPAGTPFSGTLATFTDSIPAALASQLTFSIDWGDGTAPSTGPPSVGNGTLSVPGTHTYSTAIQDTFQVQVQILWNAQVIVSGGGSASIGGVVPPVAVNDAYAIGHDQTLTIAAGAGVLANDHDSTADTLTATKVAPAAHGTVVLNSDGSFSYTPSPGFSGPDSFTYQASDDSLVSNVATVFLAVFNGAPVARNDAYTAVHDRTLTIAGPGVLLNDSDPVGLPLTAVLETIGTSEGGTVTVNADGSFAYTPKAQYHGPDSFTYIATNGGLDSSPATVTINVTEQMPVARNDTYTVPDDPTLDVQQQSVLLNDTDPDGDSLTAGQAMGFNPEYGTLDFLADGRFFYTPAASFVGTATFTYEAFDGLDFSLPVTVTINVSNQQPTAESASYTIPAVATSITADAGVLATATDPFGRPLTAVEGTGPGNGSLALNSDGSFTYTPNAGFTGPDSFTFKASDGLSDSDPATVTLNVENTLPSPGPAQPGGSTYTYAVQPGGSTSWTAAAGVLSAAIDPYGYALTAAQASGPAHGTLTLNSDGSFTYTPSTSFTGPDTFTYTVNDGVYTSTPATVTINVDSNELPAADTGAAYTYAVPPDQLLTTTSSDGVLSRATDPYGYDLTAAPVGTATNNADGSFTYTTAHSTLTVNPDGSFVYTPGMGFSGTDTFPYLASDGLNNSTEASFTVHVDNTELPTTDAGAAYSFAVQPGATLTTTSDNGLLSAAFDPYGYDLTAVPVGTATTNADGSFTYTTVHSTLTVNPDGSFTYTTSADFTGLDTFAYQASDGLNDSPSATVTIDVSTSAIGSGGGSASGGTDDSSGDVTDPAPVAEDDSYTIAPNQTLLTPIGQGVLANDSDPGGLTLTATLVPNEGVTHGTLSLQGDGLFSYTPAVNFAGTDTFTYKAGDGTYTSAAATVTIAVTADAPGGTDDGGVAFQGAGLTASNGYGGVTGTGGATSPGTIVAPDNFDPTVNGPGLAGPGVYAAGTHASGSQASTLLGSAPATLSFPGEPTESEASSVPSGPLNNVLNGILPHANAYYLYLQGTTLGIDTSSHGSPSSFSTITGIPAVGLYSAAIPTVNSYVGSGSTSTGNSSDYVSSGWSVSDAGGIWAGTLTQIQFDHSSLIDLDSSSVETFSSGPSGFSVLETYSDTSYYHDDVKTTVGETVEDNLTYTSVSQSFSYGTMAESNSETNSNTYSFWGGGDSYSENGTSTSSDSGTDNSNQSSSDNWQDVDSQYSGGNGFQVGVSSSVHYQLSDDIESGNDTTYDGSTSVAITGGTSQTTHDSASHQSSTLHYSAGQNEVNNTNNYSSSDSGTDTNHTSSSSSNTSITATTAGSTDTTFSTDSSSGESDQYSDSTSYDGLGHSVLDHGVSETESGTDDSINDSEGGYTLSGYPHTWSNDNASQDQASGAASLTTHASNSVTSSWSDISASGSGQTTTDSSSTTTYAINGGWSDTVSSSDTWGSYDSQYDNGASSDGLGHSSAGNSTSLTQYGSDTLTNDSETSTSVSGTVVDSTLDSATHGLASVTNLGDFTTTNGVSSSWSSTSSNDSNTWNTNNGYSNNHTISGGWDHSTYANDTWGTYDDASTSYAGYGGTSMPDNTIDSTVTETSGDSITSHDETSTSLSGLSNDITTVSWASDTASETLKSDGDSTSNDTHSFTSFGASGTRSADWTDVQDSRTFSSSSFDNGTENETHGTGWFYSYNDQSDLATHTTGPLFSSVVSTSADSTHTASGQDDNFTNDQGSDTFSSLGYTGSTGTNTQDAGSEQFGFAQAYSDTYNDQTISHSSNDGQGHTSSSRTISHTDQGSNGWSWDVDGSDTFSMSATDPSTSDTSWDNGGENYAQGEARTTSFGDTSTSSSSTTNGTLTTSSTLTHTNGGSDTLSSGDQVGHEYGSVSIDPTTGDVASVAGLDNYTLVKNYGDAYTNLSNGATTTHSDSGFGGASYSDQGTEQDVTTTTDPSTGDVSTDQNTDTSSENDGSTESFTDQGLVTGGTDSTSHTDSGSDSVSSSDQDTDISSDTSNSGLSTDGTSDTTTEWDSSSDSYGDQSSDIKTTLGSAVTVTNSSTHTDSGSDADSTDDQGTDTSSDESSEGLEADFSGDTYTNTESSSENYTDQSFDYENVASGVVVSASSSDSSTDTESDSSGDDEFGSFSSHAPADAGTESVVGSFSDVDSSGQNETATSQDLIADNYGTITGSHITNSDQDATVNSTEASSGGVTFTGITVDGKDYFGTGIFIETSSDWGSSNEHDHSETTLDPYGLFSGTDYETLYESDSWSDTSQDNDSVNTAGTDPDAVTVTEQDNGTSISNANVSTNYSAGSRSEEDGSTLQTMGTDSLSDKDSQSSYGVVTVANMVGSSPTASTVTTGTPNSPQSAATKVGTNRAAIINQSSPGRPLSIFERFRLREDYGT